MEALKEWVRTLAMLLILASCLELLVPMGGMKKYVRMAMGLLVMLCMINPLFAFLGKPVDLDPAVFAPQTEAHLPSLDEIMAEASRFREKNEALALEQTRRRLEEEAARAARSVEGVADARVEVALAAASRGYGLERITVVITPGRQGGVRPVWPVLPVQPGGGEEPVGAGRSQPRPPQGSEEALAQQVRQEVAGVLGVAAGAAPIDVLVQPESASQRR